MPDGRIDGELRAVVAPGHAGTSDHDLLERPWPGTGVVVGVDDSLSFLGAVAWAAAEVDRRRLPLYLVQVPPPPAGPIPHQGTERRARALLRRARGVVGAVTPSAPVTIATVSGSVGPALVSYAAHARLLVVGSHRLDGPIQLAACRVLAAVTAHARCPAVVVPRKWAGSWASTPCTHPIIVGVDGFAGGERALASAAETADRRGVPLIPLTAGTGVSAGIAGGAGNDSCSQRSEEQKRGLITRRLASCQERYRGLRIEPLIVAANPVESLLEVARRAQLIVVGSRGPAAVPGVLLGSTSQTMLRSSPCAVVVLSPFTADPCAPSAPPCDEVTGRPRAQSGTATVRVRIPS